MEGREVKGRVYRPFFVIFRKKGALTTIFVTRLFICE
jgi:hypothetical protein